MLVPLIMFHSEWVLTTLNLSAIPFQRLDLLRLDIVLDLFHDTHVHVSVSFKLLEEMSPKLGAFLIVKVRIQDLCIDMRHENGVKCPESVGRQNQDALEVARGSEKVGDKISAAIVKEDFGIFD